jgi:formate dehydrogenase subunit delta
MKSIDMLVRMANQIAANLQHETDPAAATAHHIRLYWDPRMKAQIKAYGGEGLTPTAKAAVDVL